MPRKTYKDLTPNQLKSRLAADDRKAAFLAALRGDNGTPVSVRRAAEIAGISRTTVRSWRESDPDFDAAYADAMEDGTDLLEDAGFDRATNAVTGVQLNKAGEEVEVTIAPPSDSLLKFMLAGRRPHYRGDGPVVNVLTQNNSGPNNEQLARAMALLLAEAKAQQEGA